MERIERHILGVMVLFPEVIPHVSSVVQEEAFNTQEHRWIYRILSLHPESSLAIWDEKLRQYPGEWALVLVELAQGVTSKAFLVHYLSCLRRASLLYDLKRIMDQTLRAIRDTRPWVAEETESVLNTHLDKVLLIQRMLPRSFQRNFVDDTEEGAIQGDDEDDEQT